MQSTAEYTICAMAGPAPARDNASCAYDAPTNTLYLFGGCDKTGAATNTLYKLQLSTMLQDKATWKLVEDTTGVKPSPRWGHSSFVWGNRLWVYAGCSGSIRMDDLHCFDLSNNTWVKAKQAGCLPDRKWADSKQQMFGAAVLCGSSMLAFGKEPQDENSNPNRLPSAPALQLHSYNLQSHTWSKVPITGSITFEHHGGMVVYGSKLVCAGWSWPQDKKTECCMQVCTLDLQAACRTPQPDVSPMPRRTPTAFSPAPRSLRSRMMPCWTQQPVQGSAPSARIGCAAAMLGSKLVLHGGVLCSAGVQGQLTSDTFCLDLGVSSSPAWMQLQPSQDKKMGGSSSSSTCVPRVGHHAVAVHGAVLILGGTASRQCHASCSTMEYLKHSSSAANPAATAAPLAATAAAAPGSVPTAQQQAGAHTHVPTTTVAAGNTPAAASNSTGAAGNPLLTLCSTQGRMPGSAAAAAGQATPGLYMPSSPSVAGAAAATPLAAASALRASLLPSYDFSAYCCQESLSDVELVVGGVTFPAHRLLLCQSDRLRELLSRAGNRQQQALECRWKLHLHDVFPDVLKMMLQYMYGCLEAIPPEAAPLVFKASDRYGLPGLRATCLSALISSISLETVASHALLAYDHNCEELTQACVEYTATSSERMLQVLSTPGYLHLNQTNPVAGQAFLKRAMRHLTV